MQEEKQNISKDRFFVSIKMIDTPPPVKFITGFYNTYATHVIYSSRTLRSCTHIIQDKVWSFVNSAVNAGAEGPLCNQSPSH